MNIIGQPKSTRYQKLKRGEHKEAKEVKYVVRVLNGDTNEMISRGKTNMIPNLVHPATLFKLIENLKNHYSV